MPNSHTSKDIFFVCTVNEANWSDVIPIWSFRGQTHSDLRILSVISPRITLKHSVRMVAML